MHDQHQQPVFFFSLLAVKIRKERFQVLVAEPPQTGQKKRFAEKRLEGKRRFSWFLNSPQFIIVPAEEEPAKQIEPLYK